MAARAESWCLGDSRHMVDCKVKGLDTRLKTKVNSPVSLAVRLDKDFVSTAGKRKKSVINIVTWIWSSETIFRRKKKKPYARNFFGRNFLKDFCCTNFFWTHGHALVHVHSLQGCLSASLHTTRARRGKYPVQNLTGGWKLVFVKS